MGLRFKIFQPNQPLKAAEVNDIAGNSVVEIDAEADLNNVDLAEVNVVYRKDLAKLQIRKTAGTGSANWSLPFDSAAPEGGTGTGDYDESVQGDYKYFVLRDTQQFTVTGGGNVQLMLVGAGGGGAASTTDSSGGGGGAGGSVQYWIDASVEPGYTYDVEVGRGGAGVPGTEGAAGPAGQTGGTTKFVAPSEQYVNGQRVDSKTWTAAGGLGGQWTNTQPSSQVQLDTDSAAAVGAAFVGGSGNPDAGPAAPLYAGQGGNGGFSRRASYPQETTTRTEYYEYDCSYGARGETVTCTGTRYAGYNCNPCPGSINGQPVLCHGPCDCMFRYWTASQGYLWNSRGGSCPGGYSGCVNGQCSQQYSYGCGTNYYCDSGGSLQGSTCRKSCVGSRQVTETVPCRAGYVASGGNCVDSGVQGGGRGSDGLVVLRYQDS